MGPISSASLGSKNSISGCNLMPLSFKVPRQWSRDLAVASGPKFGLIRQNPMIRFGCLAILADHLFGEIRLRKSDLDPFQIGLQEPARVIGSCLDIIVGTR